LLWLRFFARKTMAHVFEGLEAAFASFGGVPSELLFDQMKAVITQEEPDTGGQVTENAEFLLVRASLGLQGSSVPTL